jgi:hypothetical protein
MKYRVLNPIVFLTTLLVLVSRDYRGHERMALDYDAHRVITRTATRGQLLSVIRELSQQTAKEALQEVP